MRGSDDSWWSVRARLRLIWAPGAAVLLATVAALVVGLALDGDARSRALLVVLGCDLLVVVGLTVLVEATLRRTVERPLIRLATPALEPPRPDRFDSRELAGIADTIAGLHVRVTTADAALRREQAHVERLVGVIAERDRELGASHERESELARGIAEFRAKAEDHARRARLAQADLDRFAYAATHDMQDPLRRIVSFGRMLQERYQDVLDRRGNQYIDFTIDNARRLQVLIDEMVTLTEVGRSRAEPIDVDLGEVVRLAWQDMADRVEDTGAELTCSELPVVHADPALLATLVQHVLGNAVKFQRPYTSPVIRVEAVPWDGDGWRITVTDNGIGIPPEFAERVFAAFQRLHPRETYTGSGIGLAMAKRIVDQHGGRISVDTDHTDGARIVFTLPGAAASVGPDAAPDPPHADEGTDAPDRAAPDAAGPADTPAPPERAAQPSNRDGLAYVSVASAPRETPAPEAITEAPHGDDAAHRDDPPHDGDRPESPH